MKSVNDLTRQRNMLQERLINTGDWKRHPTFYKKIENAWQNYICNIEKYVEKKLVNEGFASEFANTKHPKYIYTK